MICWCSMLGWVSPFISNYLVMMKSRLGYNMTIIYRRVKHLNC